MSDDVVTVETTEVRCPAKAKGLLGKLVIAGDKPTDGFDNLLIQLHCSNCTKDLRSILGADRVLRVLHLYNVVGDFVKTQVQFRGDHKEVDLNPETQMKVAELSAAFTKRP